LSAGMIDSCRQQTRKEANDAFRSEVVYDLQSFGLEV
jgi:hypothetical protein